MNENDSHREFIIKQKFPECRVFKSISFSETNLEYEIENLSCVNVTDLHIPNTMMFIDDNKVYIRFMNNDESSESPFSLIIVVSLWVLLLCIIMYKIFPEAQHSFFQITKLYYYSL